MSLLSNYNNCIFYNAIILNKDLNDDQTVSYLQNFRAVLSETEIKNYYDRSTNIVNEIKGRVNYSQNIWNNISEKYIKEIILDLKSNNITAAKTKIYSMLDKLEQGV